VEEGADDRDMTKDLVRLKRFPEDRKLEVYPHQGNRKLFFEDCDWATGNDSVRGKYGCDMERHIYHIFINNPVKNLRFDDWCGPTVCLDVSGMQRLVEFIDFARKDMEAKRLST